MNGRDSAGPGAAGPGYPAARRLELTEDIGGYQVSDPYRWLEGDTSAERSGWLAEQAGLFGSYREKLPGRDRLAARVRELLGTGYAGTPAWRDERSFYTRRDPGAEHGVLDTRLGGEPEQVLIDPMAIDPSGLTTLDAWQPDKEGRLLAYQLSEGGDEESLLRVIDVTTGSLADGPIDRCRYSNVAWLPGGKAFYYTRRLPPEAVPDGESQYHRRVYLHQVGTPADSDVLIFGAGRDKTDYYSVSVSRDGRWLVVGASRGTAPRNDLWIADLSESDPASPDLRVIQEGIDAQTGVRVGRDGRLYVFTDYGAPRGRIAVTDPADPRPAASWPGPCCWPSGPGTRSARSPCTTWPRASK
jgi:prolyl oligopeptidase